MKIHFPAQAIVLSGLLLAGLAACRTPSADDPSKLTPFMANPPPQPVPVPIPPEQQASVSAGPEAVIAGTKSAGLDDGVLAGSLPSVPGVTDPWIEIKDYPFDRRADFVARVDTSMGLLNGAVSTARLSQAKPGRTEAHLAAIRQMDSSMTALDQARSALTFATAESWEGAKNNFHTAWEAASMAQVRARASGI